MNTNLKTKVPERHKNQLDNFSVFYEKNYTSKIGFNEMFRVSYTLLRKLGLPSLHSVFSGSSGNGRISVIVFPLILATVLFGISALVNNAIYEWNRDMHKALEIIPIIFTTTLGWFGAVLMYSTTRKINRLLEELKTSWTKELREGVDNVTIETAKRSIAFTVLYAILIITVGALYLGVPFLQAISNIVTAEGYTHFDLNIRPVPTRYPFNVDTVPKYILCTIFEVACTFFITTSYVSVDTLFLQSTTIVSLLLQIVGKKFREIAVYSNAKALDRQLLRKLHHIGRQHSELLSYCRKIEEIFNPVIFATIIFSSVSLCLCVIALQSKLSELKLGDAAASMFHFIAIVMQPFIYCNTAENISQWTNNIAEAIYSCQWPDQSRKFKKIVLLIMIRSQRNYQFRLYGLVKVDRHLLTQLAQTAFNFFMLLRKTAG